MNFDRTFFVTSVTHERTPIFANEQNARRFFQVLYNYRRQHRFLLDAFVLMPDHFHLLLTPAPDLSLERAIQLIKGGFSHLVRRHWKVPIWQASFTNHRIRDRADFEYHYRYIEQNPVVAHLAAEAREYRYCSAYPGWKLDLVTGAEAQIS